MKEIQNRKSESKKMRNPKIKTTLLKHATTSFSRLLEGSKDKQITSSKNK